MSDDETDGRAASSSELGDSVLTRTAPRPHLARLSPGDARRPEAAIDNPRPAEPALPVISIGYVDPALAPAAGVGRDAGAHLEVVKRLGEGGMGVVYLARQRTLDRDVAVKLARSEEPTPAVIASMFAEARLTGSLEHPNIVPIHALGTDAAGRPVLVMKRIEGVVWSQLLHDPNHAAWSLDHLRSTDRLTVHLEILMQIASALHYAHSRGIVHRDVKPDNVMLGSFGEVYLLDWGLAYRIGAPVEATMVGTPGYAAPEMVLPDASPIDARTDVYLLGATLHEILTGRRRHPGKSIADRLASAGASEPVQYAPDVPAELAALCNAATARDPQHRPATAAAFRQAIASYLHHRSSIEIAASARRTLDRVREQLRKHAPVSDIEIAASLAEARFGFLEALRGWPENQLARRGADDCLCAMIDREIAHRNPTAARALLAQLSSPRRDIVHRLAALETDLRETRRREQELARAAHEGDRSVSALPRLAAMAVLLLVVSATSFQSTREELRTGVMLPVTDIIITDCSVLGTFAVALIFWGRRMLANQYNRRMYGAMIFMTMGVTLMDIIAWTRGLDSRTANLNDSITLTVTLAIVAIGSERRWWWVVGVMAAAIAVSVLVPPLTNGVTQVAVVLALLLIIEITWRQAAAARRKKTTAPTSSDTK